MEILIELDDLEDFDEMLDYYFDENNAHPEVKNYEKWHHNKYAAIYKETTWLYPTEEDISGKDWTKIIDCFVGYKTFTGPGAPALTTEVKQIATCFKELSYATKNLKNVIIKVTMRSNNQIDFCSSEEYQYCRVNKVAK